MYFKSVKPRMTAIVKPAKDNTAVTKANQSQTLHQYSINLLSAPFTSSNLQ